MFSRTTSFRLVGFCLFALASSIAVASDPVVAAVSPAAALARLKEGNARFVADPVSKGKPTAARRAETAHSQRPFAIIVGCADSRTSPELVFDQNIGDLFVVRTAGNLVDDYGLGSIEYAVDHLGTRLIVVLGHERCGAVKAAKGEPGDPLANAVKTNARLVAEKIRKEAELGEHKSEVRIVSGYYDLDTGVVEWPDAKETPK